MKRSMRDFIHNDKHKNVICDPRWVLGVLCTPLCIITSLFFKNVILGDRMQSRSHLLYASRGQLQ